MARYRPKRTQAHRIIAKSVGKGVNSYMKQSSSSSSNMSCGTIFIIVIFIIIALVLTLPQPIAEYKEKNDNYKLAIKYLDKGRLGEAYNILDELDPFKKSTTLLYDLEERIFLEAQLDYETGNYEIGNLKVTINSLEDRSKDIIFINIYFLFF